MSPEVLQIEYLTQQMFVKMAEALEALPMWAKVPQLKV